MFDFDVAVAFLINSFYGSEDKKCLAVPQAIFKKATTASSSVFY